MTQRVVDLANYPLQGGGADDTAVFDAAVAALPDDSAGSVLRIPPGPYITAGLLLGRKAACLTIDAPGCELRQLAGSTRAMIWAGNGVDYVPEFRVAPGLRLSGFANKDAGLASMLCGIVLQGCENPVIDNVNVSFFAAHGIRFLGNARVGSYGRVRSSYVTSCGGCGVSIEGGVYSIQITGNILSGHGRVDPASAAVSINGSDTHNISDNLFDVNSIDIQIVNCSSVKVGRNVHENTKRNAIRLIGGRGHSVSVGSIDTTSTDGHLIYNAVEMSCVGSIIGDMALVQRGVQTRAVIQELPGAANNMIGLVTASGGGNGVQLLPNSGSKVVTTPVYY